ncbi:MAG: GNAT family N-acetyltransferase [Promethearchaeota archaeon]
MPEKIFREFLDKVVHLRKDQINAAAETLARSFYNYPLLVHVFSDESDREQKLNHLFRFIIRYGLRYGEVYTTSENLEGIAVWLPPEESNTTMLKQIRCFSLSFLVRIGRILKKRYLPIDVHAKKAHGLIAPFPHWYLRVIGIDPIHQKKGFGKLLINYMITRLEIEKTPIYLETYLEKNVDYYENLGFKLLEESSVLNTGLKRWHMIKIKK